MSPGESGGVPVSAGEPRGVQVSPSESGGAQGSPGESGYLERLDIRLDGLLNVCRNVSGSTEQRVSMTLLGLTNMEPSWS